MFDKVFLSNGQALRFQPGRPHSYGGKTIAGSIGSFVSGSWGQIFVQDIQRLHWKFRYLIANVHMGQRIYSESIGKTLTTTAVLKNSCRQTIAGAGKTFLKERQFASAFMEAWSRRLDLGKNGEIITLETAWDAMYVSKLVHDHPELRPIVDASRERIPVLIGEPYRSFTPVMSHLIDDITDMNYHDEATNLAANDLMEEYLMEILHLSNRAGSHLNSIPPVELKKVRQARQLIVSNRNSHFTIPDIARIVDLNEFTLKLRFKQVEGKGLFEFLQWMRCRHVMEEILQTDLPIKAFYHKAGYSDVISFVKGFKKHVGCSPSELRERYIKY